MSSLFARLHSRSPSPGFDDRPRRGLPPPTGLLPQSSRRPANRHPDPPGPVVPINVPRGYGGASNQGGFSTQGEPSLPYGNAPPQLKGGRPPTYPLQQGRQMRNATSAAAEQRQAEEQRRQENERAMAETRESRKKVRRLRQLPPTRPVFSLLTTRSTSYFEQNKRVTTGGFQLGMDTLSTPKSSREVAPTSLGSFRPGSTGHKPTFGQAPSSASGSTQSPYFTGPSLNSRAFANGGDAYLSQPSGRSRNLEAQPSTCQVSLSGHLDLMRNLTLPTMPFRRRPSPPHLQEDSTHPTRPEGASRSHREPTKGQGQQSSRVARHRHRGFGGRVTQGSSLTAERRDHLV